MEEYLRAIESKFDQSDHVDLVGTWTSEDCMKPVDFFAYDEMVRYDSEDVMRLCMDAKLQNQLRCAVLQYHPRQLKEIDRNDLARISEHMQGCDGRLSDGRRCVGELLDKIPLLKHGTTFIMVGQLLEFLKRWHEDHGRKLNPCSDIGLLFAREEERKMKEKEVVE